MPDALAENTARLKQLVERVRTETDPETYDELSADIRRVLAERELIKRSVDVKEDSGE